MTLTQFEKLLASYGCDESHWPPDAREQCQLLIARDPAAQTLLHQYQLLVEELDQLSQPDFPGLEQKILNQDLPPRESDFLERLLNWLIPATSSSSRILRPAFAACVPLILGIVVGNFYSFGYESLEDGFQYWEDELLMISFNDFDAIGTGQ